MKYYKNEVRVKNFQSIKELYSSLNLWKPQHAHMEIHRYEEAVPYLNKVNNTPKRIKEVQKKIWLSKTSGERLKQFMEDNASLFQFWNTTQKTSHIKAKGKTASS